MAYRRSVCLLSQPLVRSPVGPYGRGMGNTEPSTVRISAGTRRVEVVAAEGEAPFHVEGTAEVELGERRITVGNVASKLIVSVAAGTDLVIGTSSGPVDVRGPVGHVAIVTASGRVQVERAASVDIRSESSRVEVGQVAGVCRIRASSGKVHVVSCGDADVAGESGRIELQRVAGHVDAHSVSGRIDVAMETAHDVRAETVTGRIEVSLPKGATPYQPTDSALSTQRPPDCDCTVIARSTTGKVVVTSR